MFLFIILFVYYLVLCDAYSFIFWPCKVSFLLIKLYLHCMRRRHCTDGDVQDSYLHSQRSFNRYWTELWERKSHTNVSFLLFLKDTVDCTVHCVREQFQTQHGIFLLHVLSSLYPEGAAMQPAETCFSALMKSSLLGSHSPEVFLGIRLFPFGWDAGKC